MSNVVRILGSGPWPRALCGAAVLVLLAACGQRGPLYLPTEPAAANRATLPQILTPGTPTQPATRPAPGTPQPSPGGTGTGTADPVRANQ
jgi:predicted small lipoprotein YifL